MDKTGTCRASFEKGRKRRKIIARPHDYQGSPRGLLAAGPVEITLDNAVACTGSPVIGKYAIKKKCAYCRNSNGYPSYYCMGHVPLLIRAF
jgi:hypothetical protein